MFVVVTVFQNRLNVIKIMIFDIYSKKNVLGATPVVLPLRQSFRSSTTPSDLKSVLWVKKLNLNSAYTVNLFVWKHSVSI